MRVDLTKPSVNTVHSDQVLGPWPRSVIPFSFSLLQGPFSGASPLFPCFLSFILIFTSFSVSTCQLFFLGCRHVLSVHTRSGWGWLQKPYNMVRSMGLSDARLRTTVLATFSLFLPLYRVFPFLQVFCEVLSVRSSSAIGLLDSGLGPLMQSGLGPQISRPHNSH